MKTLTMRAVFKRASILRILTEPEFAHGVHAGAVRDTKPANEYFFAVFVLTGESQGNGSLLLRVVSTTVVGIQRYTLARLRYQGVYVMEEPQPDLVTGMLRARFRAEDDLLDQRILSTGPVGPNGMPFGWFNRDFPNGAGDLSSPPEFVIRDRELEEFERSFNPPDTQPASGENPGK